MGKIAGFIVEKRKLIMVIYIILLIISGIGLLHTNVNYDMSQYLPDDSFTKKGMETMSGEYGELSSITVMFDNLDEEERGNIKEELAAIQNVRSVVYLDDDENYQKGNHSKYMLTVLAGTYSDEAKEVLNTVKDHFKDYKIAVSGPIVDNDLLVSTLMNEIPTIILIVVPIIMVILFMLCDSWIEPFLFLGCIGVAVLINMGTNALLPSVSFMTFAVGALLQLGLSMDYSIMLMNRYSQEKLEDPEPKGAMKRALVNAFGAITGSSVTTIVGLLVLVFMSFKIGMDMGIVLAKGVFFSLVCIFTFLPGLIIMCDKLVTKTHKKALNFKMDFLMKLVLKAKFVLIPALILLVIFAVAQKDSLGISFVKFFDNEDQEKIEEVFGVDNQIVLLYDKAEKSEKLDEYIQWLEAKKNVNEVQDYSNTIGEKYTYKRLAEEMDMDEGQAKLMYQMYKDNKNTSAYEKITMYDLICYMDKNVAHNASYEDFMTKKERKQITDAKKELDDGKKKIADGEKELADGEKEISDGESEIAKNDKKMDDSEKELSDGEKELAKNEKELAEGEKQIAAAEKTMAKNEKKLVKGEKQLAKAEKQLEKSEKQISDGEKQLAGVREQLKNMGLSEEQIQAQIGKQETQMKAGRTKLEAGKKELAKNKKTMVSSRKQLDAGKKKLKKEKKKLVSGRKQLEAGKKKLNEGRKQLDDGRVKIADAKKELEDGRKELKDGKKELKDNKEIFDKPMDLEELADVMDQSVSDVENMLKIRRMSMLDVEGDTMTLEEFLEFIASEILPDETYARAISDDMLEDIEDGQKEIEDNKDMMVGEKYNRMVVSMSLPTEGEETFSLVGQMKEQAEETFSGETWLVGDSGMGYEMDAGFTKELNLVTILTIVSILVVVWITFRSLISAATLVAVIQSAIFIITAIVAMSGVSVNYIALILVQCILMGATIDYGILYISNYREVRMTEKRRKAVSLAMNLSIRTIMTSSFILFSCCMTVGVLMTQKVISQTCSVIAYGVLCAVVLIIFVLPALAYVLDGFIVKNGKED